jgi:hypothetical protein
MGSMKQAYKAQYMSKFCKSSDSIGQTSSVGEAGVQSSKQDKLMPPHPGSGGDQDAAEEAEEAEDSSSRKKKSRWE